MEALQDLIQLLNTKDWKCINNEYFMEVLQNAKIELLNDIEHYNKTGESKPLPNDCEHSLILLTDVLLDILKCNKDK